MDISNSIDNFIQAKKVLPGGVNSPVRAFKAVGGQPLFIDRGEGPYIIDVDGNRYIDYVLSWGPLILGHAHPEVVSALEETLKKGTSFGAPSPLEIRLSELIQSFMPNLEMLRYVNSGTEATMSALRLARAYTKRNKIIKFEGCYHGHADMLLARAGSGVVTLGLPDSPGVPPSTVHDTLVVPYNDFDAVKNIYKEHEGEIAAIIVEPVAGNMGVVPPVPGFLEGLRSITEQNDSLLIFDEVMTGFRVHPGGAQTLFKIKPDLTTIGKVIGGGLPIGAYGGRREIMEQIAPVGPVYQAGTFSGNPMAMTGGIATLTVLKQDGIWKKMESAVSTLSHGIAQAAQKAGVPIKQTSVGTMFSTFFTENDVINWFTVKTCDTEFFGKYFQKLLKNGIYIAPSQFEAGFISTTHTPEVIETTIEAVKRSF